MKTGQKIFIFVFFLILVVGGILLAIYLPKSSTIKEQTKSSTTSSLTTPSSTTPAVTIWDPLKKRSTGESDIDWSDRLYTFMVPGRISNVKEGGVIHNVSHCGLNNKQILNQETASCLCENPCVWYKDKTNKSVCDCGVIGGAKAVNF